MANIILFKYWSSKMSSNLYAMLFRMKYINRWSLMRCAMNETLTQHSLETAFIAHALATITNEKLGGNINADRTAVIAMFHDAPEILTGDLPTPVKHGSKSIEAAYSEIEKEAIDTFVNMTPDFMKQTVEGIFLETDKEILKLVKAADKISALIKCYDEKRAGNGEFDDAAISTLNSLDKMDCQAAKIFMDEFLAGFSLTLDKLKGDKQ